MQITNQQYTNLILLRDRFGVNPLTWWWRYGRHGMVFDMSVWNKPTASCGTACCLLGFATELPELQRQGLVMYDDGMSRYPTLLRDLEGAGPEEAAQEIFGLDYWNFQLLFKSRYYGGLTAPTRKEVLARLDEIIAEVAA